MRRKSGAPVKKCSRMFLYTYQDNSHVFFWLMTTSNTALQSITIIIFDLERGKQRYLPTCKSRLGEKIGKWFSYQVSADVALTSPCAKEMAQWLLFFSTFNASIEISTLSHQLGKRRSVMILIPFFFLLLSLKQLPFVWGVLDNLAFDGMFKQGVKVVR